jgi:non-specific serine/threonine protein kinase
MNASASSSRPASSALPCGTRLGEFELTGVIGEGGFGIVYSAHDAILERTVAIKEYLPAAFSQRDAEGTVVPKEAQHTDTFKAGLAGFINEARLLAKFSHPGLVEVFRFWEANGTAYMAMRHYPGMTLRQVLRTSRLAVSEPWLCETLDPVLLALQELHRDQCYHRDIAPDNIMVLPNGRSVLMDFGAARRLISGRSEVHATVIKPGYAPIEQYYDDGSMVQGAWTDVYAVGGLLYHAMTGKVPVQAISRMVSDPLRHVADLTGGQFSARLCDVVMKCLAVMPDQRYQSIEELRTALGWVSMLGGSSVVHSAPMTAQEDYPATEQLTVPTPLQSLSPSQPGLSRPLSDTHAADVPVTGFALDLDLDADTSELVTVAVTRTTSQSLPVMASVGAKATVEPAAGLAPPKPEADQAPLEQPEPDLNEPLPPETESEAASPASGRDSARRAGIAVAALLLVAAGVYFFSQTPDQGSAAVAPMPAASQAVAAALAVSADAAVVAVSGAEPTTAASEVAVATPALTAAPVAGVSTASPMASAGSGGVIRIELQGGWGTVFVDGVQKGTVPPVLVVKVAAGTHQVEIRNPAVQSVSQTVTLAAGGKAVVRHNFAK